MTASELAFVAYAFCNTLRMAAYFPQMIALARRPGAAASFSHASWAMFMAANASTALYAGVVLGDWAVTAVNGISALCCGALIVLALWRNRQPRGQRASAFR